MIEKTQYRPQSVTHPGLILEEKLEEIGMSKKEFAIRSGKPEKTINQIVNKLSRITPDMAVQFETVLKIPAKFWINLQAKHDEALARERTVETCKESQEWAKRLPYADMARKGWIPQTRKIEEKVRNLLQFFGISSYQAWNDIYINQELKLAFRISLAHTKDAEALSAWLRQGQIVASGMYVKKYSARAFNESLEEAKKLSYEQPADFFDQLVEICANAGVKLVFTPCLPKAPVSGCTRWIGDHPIIQVSGRYKRNDKFWFTFFHEAGHILKHGKKDVFLEDAGNGTGCDDKEREADEFAAHWLLPETQETELLKNNVLSLEAIKEYSQKWKVHSGIIIGRLQKKDVLPWSLPKKYQSMFATLEFEDIN